MTDWHSAIVTAITPLTPRVVSVKLRPDVSRPFLAGQHIDVRLTADDGYQAQRSYSVASSPDDADLLELVVERLDEGEVSPYFHEAAAPGDRLEIRGPFAEHFVWRPEGEGPVLLIAGGSGVAPFLSMVRARSRLASAPSMFLLYSARDWGEVILRDELLTHARDQRGLQLAFCLTRDAPRRVEDFARRIDREVIDTVLSRLGSVPAQTFICGANRFVSRVADLLVDAAVSPATIRTERYGGN